MGIAVTNGASLMCTFGMTPSTLVVLPTHATVVGGVPLATITDNAPMVNILPFGMCTSLANPTVAAATAAALGVLTPMPCIPAIVTPWLTGSPTVLCGNLPVVNETSQCMCAYAGVIRPITPGQFTTLVP
jgi:hypothetical protein